MARVLVVEDEPNIADFIRRGLIYNGYEVQVAYTGEQALDMSREQVPDLVILDVILPGINGVEVCRRLRAAGQVPIIMLTARDAVTDKVEGLEAGADDYLTKPFAFEELLARVRVALRRKATVESGPIRVGDLVVDLASHDVVRGDRSISLTAREFELLEFLARHAGHVLTKEKILETVWGYEADMGSDPLKVYIRYLRQKLNAGGESDLIRSVRGVGYMLRG